MAFFGKLFAFRNHMGVSDCMRWSPSKRYIFEVRSIFRKFFFIGDICGFLFPVEEYMES